MKSTVSAKGNALARLHRQRRLTVIAATVAHVTDEAHSPWSWAIRARGVKPSRFQGKPTTSTVQFCLLCWFSGEEYEVGNSSACPVIELRGGTHIPQVGLGVFKVKPEETAAVVKAALEIGYRHIDTAQMYGNEKEVGQGIRDAGLDRSEVFITSKLNNGFHKPDDARRAFDSTLTALQSDYVDLFLIHWPLPTRYGGDFVSTWKVLEEFARDGRARSIGVSNFQCAHLELLARESGTVPAINQIEIHPYFANEQVRAYGKAHGIVIQAWSPIARGRALDDPVIRRIADRWGKSTAQVVLGWHIRRGDIVLPKSISPNRMKSNLELFDFTLDNSDMDAISALDKGAAGRIGPHPDQFDSVG